MMSEDVIIRKILMEEYSFMEDIMYEAVYHPRSQEPLPQRCDIPTTGSGILG